LGKLLFFRPGEKNTGNEDTQEDLIDVFGDGLQSDIAKVPHHGSPNRQEDFPTWVLPDVAVISCGADNPYGHPNPDVVAEWEATGADIYRTDQDGTVAVTAIAGTLSVETSD